MKIITLILLASLHCCFGEEPKVIAISDWTKPIDGCNDFFNSGNDAEHGHDFRREYKGGLNCDLFDLQGKPVSQRMSAFGGRCPASQWITLPYDSTVRLRANCFGIRSPKEGGLVLPFPGKEWFIQPTDTNTYFLSATFTAIAPINHVSDEVKHAVNVVWDGTLIFPQMQISLQH